LRSYSWFIFIKSIRKSHIYKIKFMPLASLGSLEENNSESMRNAIIILGSIFPLFLCLSGLWDIIGPHRSKRVYDIGIYFNTYCQPRWSRSIITIAFIISVWKYSYDDINQYGKIGFIIFCLSFLCLILATMYILVKSRS